MLATRVGEFGEWNLLAVLRPFDTKIFYV